MPNQTGGMLQVNPSDWNYLNFILREMQKRLDKLEGQSGSFKHQDNINLNGHNLINVKDPINPQEAATKNYVDTALAPLL